MSGAAVLNGERLQMEPSLGTFGSGTSNELNGDGRLISANKTQAEPRANTHVLLFEDFFFFFYQTWVILVSESPVERHVL